MNKVKIKKKINVGQLLLGLAIILIILMLVLNPKKYINSCYNGLSIWVKNVLPSLFPFLICTKILTEINFFDGFTKRLEKPTMKIFKAPKIASYVFLISIISGYPVGAKVISDLYKQNVISEKTANKLTTFCSTSGPLFIIGTVGTSLFCSPLIGYIMLLSHITASILNGIIYRNKYVDLYSNDFNKEINKNYNKIISNCMTNSILSILVVGGFITIFYIIIDILIDIKVISFLSSGLDFILSPFNLKIGESVFSGLIEVTRGCISLSNLNVSNLAKCVLGTGLISFGGFSIHFQALAFLSECNINTKFYFKQKITHTILSMIIAFIIGFLLLH